MERTMTIEVEIIKDMWVPSRPWYIIDANTGTKLHEIGYRTKKAAVKLIDDLVGVELVNE